MTDSGGFNVHLPGRTDELTCPTSARPPALFTSLHPLIQLQRAEEEPGL